MKNSLSVLFPEIAKEWHPTKNGDLTPNVLSSGSGKIVWWQKEYFDERTGKNFRFEWQASVRHRTRGQGCPFISGHQVWVGFNDLSTTNPETAKLWDYRKNGDLVPENVTAGSEKRVWWHLEHYDEQLERTFDFQWHANINNQVKAKGCPFLASSGYKLWKGYNDLQTRNPELASEWHPTKNYPITPDGVINGGEKKYWWLGKCGHEWQTSIKNRLKGTGCPICLSELQTSYPEQCVFYYVSKFFKDAVSRWKSNNKELDIYIPSQKVGIEYDGAYYHKNEERDFKKKEFFKGYGITVINIREADVSSVDVVENEIYYKTDYDYSYLDLAIVELLKKLGLDEFELNINHKAEERAILKEYLSNIKSNSIVSNKELFDTYDKNKNGLLNPEYIAINSVHKIWWKCKRGHSWIATPHSRNHGSGCPICSGKEVLIGFNDFETLRPELAKEWHPTKNGDLTPSQFTIGSTKKVWWQLPYKDTKTGAIIFFEWQAPIVARVKGYGCPYLSGQAVWQGYNDLETLRPELAKEWHPVKNHELKPSDVTLGSEKKVWWLCKYDDHITGMHFDFEWQATISSRVNGVGCPFLSGKAVWQGYNDLATLRPTLAKEWHTTKNGKLTPQEVTIGSGKKVWWEVDYVIPSTGKIKHLEWQEKISNRAVKGYGCPYINAGKLNSGYNDLATLYPNLAKEWHPNKNGALTPYMVTAKSPKKVWWLLTYHDEKTGKDFVFEWEAVIESRTNGAGCPYLSNKAVWTGYNDLQSQFPQIANSFDTIKNEGVNPSLVLATSQKSYWWKCENGHSWQASVLDRVSGRKGCMFCKSRIAISGFNDLQTKFPLLMNEWDYVKNRDMKPSNITPKSCVKAWWKCKFGHSWYAVVRNRVKGAGCPVCANKVIVAGFNDLATVLPQIAKQWDYEKNESITPQEIAPAAKRKVWWKCEAGHSWQAAVYSRKNGNGCPYCAKSKKWL